MAKTPDLNDLTSLTNQTSVINTINNNNAAIVTAFENTLSLDGSTPNSMQADIDMDGNRVINHPDPVDDTDLVTKSYGDANYGADAVAAAEAAAAAAEAARDDILNDPGFILVSENFDDVQNAAALVAGLVEDTITNGVTTKAPSENAVFDALALKQGLDATLTALAGLATGADKIPYSTGTDTFSQLDLSTNTSLGTSDTTLSSQKAVKAYADTKFKSIVVQTFTSSGTYTPTSGMAYCRIECIGGGGGGGGLAASSSFGAGGGGGGGAYSWAIKTAAQVGASQTVTIGAAGTAGAAGNNAGGDGGDTSVGALCVAKGGTGAGGTAANARGGNIAGGQASSGIGDFKADGFRSPLGLNTSSGWSSAGGNSVMGSGAAARTSSGDGAAALNYGAGGAGGFDTATTNRAGGVGFQGLVIITEFCI